MRNTANQYLRGILIGMQVLRHFHKKHHGGFDDYLDEAVYGANDGIITTFAVVSGAAGATLGSETIIILGLANLVADGFSMGASSYLAIKTKEDVREANGFFRRSAAKVRAVQRSLVTFLAFVVAGAVPLFPFLNGFAQGKEFMVSAVSSAATFFLVGGLRTIVTRRGFLKSGMEMLSVGAVAATLAYAIGHFSQFIVS